MTISSTTNRNDYTGNGSVNTYSYSFKIFSQSNLQVTVVDLSGVQTTLTLLTDYTVTGVGETAGGTIVLVNAGQAWLTSGNLTSGFGLTIRRVRELKQETDIRNQGDFFPEAHENEFDKQIMVDQQQQDEIDRSLKLPETEAGTAAKTTWPSVTDRASKFLAFDASGNPIGSSGTTGTVPVSSFMETLLDDTTAAAGRATLEAASENVEPNTENLIINGGFDIWPNSWIIQEPVSGVDEIAQGWVTQQDVTSVDIEREFGVAANVDTGHTSLQMTINDATGGTKCVIQQSLDREGGKWRGRQLTFTARIKSSVAGPSVKVFDGVTTTTSGSHSGGGAFETFTVTHTVSTGANTLVVDIGFNSSPSNSTIYIDSVTCHLGDEAFTYKPDKISTMRSTIEKLITYRRPNLRWVLVTEVEVVENTYRNGVDETVVIFPDGELRRIQNAADSNLAKMVITETADFGTPPFNSGLRSGISEAANTTYAIYAVKCNASDKFCLAGDTAHPQRNFFDALNTRYGLNSWVHLGYIRNGMNVFGGSGQDLDILRFEQSGSMTILPWGVGSNIPPGWVLTSGSAASLTYNTVFGELATHIPTTAGQVLFGAHRSGTGGGVGMSVHSVLSTNSHYYENDGIISTDDVTVNVWGAPTYGLQIVNSVSQQMYINCMGWMDYALESMAPLR